MGLGERIFASVYDRVMAGEEKAGLGDHRAGIVGQADGAVLEIGGGTGANLPYYGADVQTLTITEPAEPMARRLERRASGADPRAANGQRARQALVSLCRQGRPAPARPLSSRPLV